MREAYKLVGDRIGLWLFVLSLWLQSAAICHAASPVTAEQLQQLLQPLAQAHAGEVTASVQVLNANNEVVVRWELNGDQVMPTASLIKFPVMIEAYRQAQEGSVSLDEPLFLKETDKVPGSGILTDHFSSGLQLSLRDAIRLMIRYSDNTATNLVANRLGIAATAKTMADWGFAETQLHSLVFRRDTSIALPRSERYGLGSTTANDMTELLVRLKQEKLVSPAASREMLAHLMTCDDQAKLPRDLPKDCRIAHKTGSVNRTRTAAGIIESAKVKFAICVLTDKNEDTSWSDDNAAHRLIGAMARVVYDHLLATAPFEPNSEQAAVETAEANSQALKLGANGSLVETLQRTLNARINAQLSVDGDFGPATEQAVRRFQTEQQLSVSGVVDAETWKKLGTLVEQDVAVPSPEEIHSRLLSQTDALNPLAPPAVTAKAWAVLDVERGELVGHLNGHDRLPMASTTKVMTATLVLKLAEADAQVLDEVITFSERADKTIGSTAGVRAGERLAVSELLYGLLLPSGNDASVALAEHFGARLAGVKKSDEADRVSESSEDSLSDFVAAMNQEAVRLGLSQTHFVNPHGLTADGHYSSASDLAKLAVEAMRYPSMREIIQCRQRGAQAQGNNGSSRNLLWENTNRLLSQQGFIGMKTGTTDAAGACLIAVGLRSAKVTAERNAASPARERQTVVVVLGAQSSEARYIDARNLFSWAWRQDLPAAAN
jgi:D-alanyl-D-alanine carboxypeptidase (penicillin-binding protein 5/6)